MDEFRIEFSNDKTGDTEIIRFAAEDVAGALNVLSTREAGYHAEVWHGDELVCKLCQNDRADGVWIVNS